MLTNRKPEAFAFPASIKKGKRLYLIAILLCSFWGSEVVSANHNQAGEILYTHSPTDDEPFRYAFRVTTYTNINPVNNMAPADRDSLEIHWGDNTTSSLYRNNGVDENFNGIPDGETIADGIRRNAYVGVHVYDGVAPIMLLACKIQIEIVIS